MPDFETYLARHGEIWVQSLLEQFEAKTGTGQNQALPLLDRWNALMGATSTRQDRAA